MANPGVGTKFVSVNLNKSYGQRPTNSARSRPSHHVGVGTGSGGGMVVLSRTRGGVSGAAKPGPKLSVPPPLNLPSLRKEHERFDQSSALGGSAGVRNVGPGSGHGSSVVGWMRPGLSGTLLEKDGSGARTEQMGDGLMVSSPGDGSAGGGGGTYVPPAARVGTVGQQQQQQQRQQQAVMLSRNTMSVEKAVVLRGEDFPTLRATLPSALPSAQKQKDALQQKQNRGEEVLQEKTGSVDSPLSLQMRPQVNSSRLVVGNRLDENSISSHASSGGLNSKEQSRKLDRFLPGPLPLVKLNHTSDWEDDERDTGHGIPKQALNPRFVRNESILDRGLDAPRVNLSQSLVHNLSDGRRIRDTEANKVGSSWEVPIGDPHSRDVKTSSREGRDGNSWRASSSLAKVVSGGREIGVDRNGIGARPFSPSRDVGRDNKYSESNYRDSNGNGSRNTVNGHQDSRYGRRDSVYGTSGQNGNRSVEAFNSRGDEQNLHGHYGGDILKRNRGAVFQNSSMAKTSFSLGSKGLPVNDPILNFNREKRLFSNSGKPYMDDTFDMRNPFSGGLIADAKIFRRKKDPLKQADFHDPVRESFEAELERVQKLQEQERQRIAEEQARALEHARREEEERQRLAREEEEHRRRLEEEAREAAWRAEQERLEAVKRADEQKMAREEEKRRIFLEEERRKEAARKKLLELEARIARRQAEGAKDDKSSTFVGDERLSGMLKGRDGLRIANLGDWEDGERMVERITHSASSDSSSLNRSIETGSRPHSSRDGNSVLLDRGKASNFWNRDAFENGSGSTFLSNDHLNGHRSKRDGLGAGRVFPRKDFYVGPGPGPGALSSRISTKSGMPESHMFDDYPHPRGNKWNVGGDGDHYNRNSEVDTEFPDNQMDRFGDIGWGHSRSRGSLNTPYMDRFIQNTEVDGFSSFGRSRHSMRQPRVLPPPSLSSLHGSSFRAESERFGSSVFLDDESKHVRTTQMNEHNFQAGYESGYQERTDRPGAVGENQRNIISNEQIDEKNPPRCESQSSLSVSSPPDSPTHLSHDDLDDSGDFPVQAADNGKLEAFAENEHNAASEENVNVMDTSMSVAPGEDEEWAVHDGEDLQEQEEYDEEEEGFQEEDEVHEDDDDNLDLAREFEKLHSEEQEPTGKIGQMVLGFDEGVEVEIPGDDEFGDSPKNGEKTIEVQSVFGGISHDGLVGNEDSVQSENVLTEGSKENSKMIHESEKSLQDLTIQSSVVSASSLLDGVDVPSSSHIPDEPTVASPPNLTMHCQPVQPVLPKVSSVPSQAEVPPVKLQFGLFSGPTLIPSPVPAIQIGSIQMPLLRPPVGPSLTQLHSAQPPFFQFGQLRYTSAISQGISPLAPQTLSLAQPTIPAHYSLNQNPGGSLHNQAALDTSTHGSHLNDAGFVLMDNQPSPAHNLLDSSNESTSNEKNPLFVKDSMDNEVFPSQDQEEGSYLVENKMLSASVSQVEDQGHHGLTFEKNYKPMAGKRAIPGQKHKEASSSQFVSSERAFVSSKAPGSVPGSKGKRFIYAVRNTDSVLSVPVIESSHAESSGYQRRARRNIRRPEFRVRESVNGRQSESLVSSRVDEKSNFNRKVLGTSMKSGYKKDMFVNKSTKALVDSETFPVSGSLSSRVVDADGMLDRKLVKMAASKRLISTSKTSQSGEGNVTSSDISQEDVDAPLQSGVVRVFQQPGIEAPSDEDDFIEVRSKRQMLNDRREQREKEIKAKSKAIKAPRKPRSVSQTVTVPTTSSRTATPLSAEPVNCVHSEPVVSEGWASANDEVSTGFTNGIVSPPLPPIGTPSSTDTQFNGRSLTTKSVKTSSVPVISSVGTNLVPGLSFEDNVITPFGSWANVCIGQQVMALTQNQLDEAMKPAQFDTHVAPIVDHTVVVLESEKPSTSILTQDKSFTSSASPVSSLLAGEKIQFGAVTSPTVLPPSSLPVSSIGPPGSCISVDHNLSSPDGGCMIFFDKEKQPNGSRVQLEDPEAEAEAEAAASAVAVAAISSDELVGSGLDSSSVSVSGTKSFGGADVVSLSSGCGTGDQQLPSQSRGEESLTVALPADLSVDTPSLSLWPPLPSPHNSSGPMLSHFPGAPPSHFPCFEMNPMFGGPVFAFGPHDESASNQPQSQKSNTAATGSLGTWQPCHSGVDSFYGPPAGFTAPFISPGGIPGVQGPPHMVVYNHFTPVGQFGQVGLSFMGTTYIPSGKQPDWKHTPGTSAVGVSEGDIHNLNAASGQHNPPNVPTPIQHLSPGSPLLPVASPFAMFDLSPFQSSADVPVQARWTHVPSSPLHPVPPMPSLQQQADGGLPSQYTHGLPVDTSNVTTFQESRSSTLANDNRSFPPVSGSATRLPDELGLMDPSSATAARVPTSRPTSYASVDGNVKVENMTKSSSRGSVSDASQSGIIGNDSSGSNSCGSSTSTSTLKAQPNSSAPHFLQPIGYTEQRGGGISQKIVSGGDWHRRSGFQGRNQSTGPDKNFASSKMKQIYVAKAASSVPTTTD